MEVACGSLRLEVVEDFHYNMNANIRHFLKDREKVLTIHLEQKGTWRRHLRLL